VGSQCLVGRCSASQAAVPNKKRRKPIVLQATSTTEPPTYNRAITLTLLWLHIYGDAEVTLTSPSIKLCHVLYVRLRNTRRPVHNGYSLMWRFSDSFFFGAFCSSTIHSTAKVPEEANRKLRVKNTLVQLLALYTDPERHNTQRYRRTDRQTDDSMNANSRSY